MMTKMFSILFVVCFIKLCISQTAHSDMPSLECSGKEMLESLRNLSAEIKEGIFEHLTNLKDEIKDEIKSDMDKQILKTVLKANLILEYPSSVFLDSYVIVGKKEDWQTAKSFCHHLSGHLLSINNEAEWEHIVELMRSNKPAGCSDIWTSGRRTDNGNWFFDGPVPVLSSLWRYNQPSGNGQCVQLYSKDYKLDDDRCKERECYICEI